MGALNILPLKPSKTESPSDNLVAGVITIDFMQRVIEIGFVHNHYDRRHRHHFHSYHLHRHGDEHDDVCDSHTTHQYLTLLQSRVSMESFPCQYFCLYSSLRQIIHSAY